MIDYIKEPLLLSVIVPVYNVERYLKKCVDSIIGQTYHNLEIILVDDGSNDKSSQICDSYKEKDRRITVIHKKNGGLSDARNAGINKAQGDVFSFIDSDDFIHPRMFEYMIKMMSQKKADIVCCGLKKIYEKQELNIKSEFTEIKYLSYSGSEAVKEIYEDKCIEFTVVWNKLYKKELFSKIRFPVGKLHEDEFVTYQLLYRSKSVIYIDIPLYFYLQRENSITSEKSLKRCQDTIAALEQRIVFFKKAGEAELSNRTKFSLLNTIILQYYLENKKGKKKCKKRYHIILKENCDIMRNYKGSRKLRLKLFEISPILYRILIIIPMNIINK